MSIAEADQIAYPKYCGAVDESRRAYFTAKLKGASDVEARAIKAQAIKLALSAYYQTMRELTA